MSGNSARDTQRRCRVIDVDSVVQLDDGRVTATWRTTDSHGWVTSVFPSLDEAPAWVRDSGRR